MEYEILKDAVQCFFKDLPDNPEFKVDKETGEIWMYANGELWDNDGELYMAIYHLATKLFPNTEFRSLFDNPNVIMADLYKQKEN